MEPSTLYTLYEELQSQRNILQTEIDISLDILDSGACSTDTKRYHAMHLRLKFLKMAALNEVYLDVVNKLFV